MAAALSFSRFSHASLIARAASAVASAASRCARATLRMRSASASVVVVVAAFVSVTLARGDGAQLVVDLVSKRHHSRRVALQALEIVREREFARGEFVFSGVQEGVGSKQRRRLRLEKFLRARALFAVRVVLSTFVVMVVVARARRERIDVKPLTRLFLAAAALDVGVGQSRVRRRFRAFQLHLQIDDLALELGSE